MRIGVTGSRELSAAQRRQAHRVLRGIFSVYSEDDELHHGDAIGIDRIAKEEANRFGLKVVPHPSKGHHWKQYKDRNKEIVNAVEFLIALHSPTSQTGGTIWTYNYATRRGVRTEWVELDDA